MEGRAAVGDPEEVRCVSLARGAIDDRPVPIPLIGNRRGAKDINLQDGLATVQNGLIGQILCNGRGNVERREVAARNRCAAISRNSGARTTSRRLPGHGAVIATAAFFEDHFDVVASTTLQRDGGRDVTRSSGANATAAISSARVSAETAPNRLGSDLNLVGRALVGAEPQ